jgi:hypothetical protein
MDESLCRREILASSAAEALRAIIIASVSTIELSEVGASN